MTVRKAQMADLTRIADIYSIARQYMRDTGNPDQWSDTYPPAELTLSDLRAGALHVIEDDSGICGVFAFFPDGDPIYDSIDGKWINALPHGAIHRVASDGTRRGVLGTCVEYCLTKINNLKIDTYKSNTVMQGALKKCGFEHCGTVTAPYLGECMAFQLYKNN